MFAHSQAMGIGSGESSGQLSLRELIARVAQEVEVNSILASDFHDVISELAAKNMSSDVIERLQSLDLISQTLVEIGIFLDLVSAACPPDLFVSESLLDNIKLAALRDRLQGKAPDVAGAADPELW